MAGTTASADTTQGLRRIVARRDGYSCYLCGVPTAATLEHVASRQSGGKSRLPNLRLACPYCNSAKGSQSVEDFIKREGWRIEPPADLPDNTKDMLAKYYGWKKKEGIVYTGSSTARLELRRGAIAVLVRAGDRDRWRRLALGPQSHPRVALATWDFLRRHNTPPRPKRFPSAKAIAAAKKKQKRIPLVRPD